MSDIIHELRGNAFPAGQAYINLCERAADEIEKLRGEVAKWQGAFEASEGWRVEIVAERNAAVALLQEVNERFIYKGRGSTHWESCDESHPDCAMAKRIKAVLDAARGEK